jgi:hypothetical protein
MSDDPTTAQPTHSVVSMRIPADLRAAIDAAAKARRVTVSDLMREAVQRLLATPIGWRCEHMSLYARDDVVKWDGCQAGCVMRPVFHRSEVELTDAAA